MPDAFDLVLQHLRRSGPLVTSTTVGDLRVVADPAISQVYVYDKDIRFHFAFYPWFGEVRGRAYRQMPGGEFETPVRKLQSAASPTALVSLLVRTSAGYIERIRNGR